MPEPKISEEVDVYAVGLLEPLLWLRAGIRLRRRDGVLMGLRGIRRTVRYLRGRARARDWRAVRNTFNGYLAEHPAGGVRCGHGWTKRRALRDLRRHLAEVSR